MATYLRMDKAGRVVIPKAVRKELRLEPGDSLAIEKVGDEITLRPLRGTGSLRKQHGVWVYRDGQPMTAFATDEILRQIRQDRALASLGKGE